MAIESRTYIGIEISVVIPTFRETDRLPATLIRVFSFLETHYPSAHEVIVVDDPESFGKYTLIPDEFLRKLTFLKQPQREGKGAAVTRGMLSASGKVILFMDADSSTSIEEYLRFAPFFRDNCMAVGVRSYCEKESKNRRIIGLAGQLFLHLVIFKKAVPDSQCGFKAFSNSVAKTIFNRTKTKGGMIDAEIFFIAHKLNIPVHYVPVDWKNSLESRINILMCLFKDPIDVFKILIRDLFGYYK